jgi:hypothetical protein
LKDWQLKSKFAAALVAFIAAIPNLGLAGTAETEYLHSERDSVRDVYCGGYVSKAASLTKPLGDMSRQFEDFRMKAANVGAQLLVVSDFALRKESRDLQDVEFRSGLNAGKSKTESDWAVLQQNGGSDALSAIINQMGACAGLLQHPSQ